MIDLSEFDDAFGKPAAETIPSESVIPNGIYTLVFPCGSHRTFRIYTKKATAKFAPGKRVIGLLVGPDNTSDYDNFGFVDDAGIHLWRRRRELKLKEYADLLWMLATGCEAEGYELEVSRRCLRCNRVLTTPAAVERGIGDECLRILGGG